jgi:hypothetical protein
MALTPIAIVVRTITASRAPRRPVLPEPGLVITAPSDLPIDDDGVLTVAAGMLPIEAPKRESVTMFLSVLRYASFVIDPSAFRVVTDGATVFFFPLVAFEPPAEGGGSLYCRHAEQLPAPAAIAPAGTINAATKIQLAIQLAITLRENTIRHQPFPVSTQYDTNV